MGRLWEIIGNQDAIAGVLGQVLMTCMGVILFTMLAVFIFSHSTPVGTAHIKVEDRVDIPKDIIYIKHTGGEPLTMGDLEIVAYINGERHVYSPTNISEGLGGKNTWELADVIEINVSKEWNCSLTDSDLIEVVVINHGNKEALQGIRVARGIRNFSIPCGS